MERRLQRRCMAQDAYDVMPDVDKERLRTDSNSGRITRLEAAYTRAKRDVKLRLTNECPLERTEVQGEEPASVWDFFAKLYVLVKEPKHMAAWASVLIYNQRIRVRGKDEKTCPELKALLDCMTDEGLLCYDKKTRVYSVADCYTRAVRQICDVELALVNRLLAKRQIRER